jgi:hypothetical protein
MAFWGYDKSDDTSKREQTIAAKRATSFVAGVLAFFSAIFWYVPKDLFTTAAWLDSRGLGLLYADSAVAFRQGSVWDITGITVPVSEEAFRFGAGIMLASLMFGILFQIAGSYTKDGQINSIFHFTVMLLTGKIRIKDVNWEKLSLLSMFVLVIGFDSYTDFQFSSRFGEGPVLDALFYSIIIYNVMSEFFLIRGLQMMIGNAPEAIAGVFKMVWATITGLTGKSSPGRPQSKPPQGASGGGRQDQQIKKPPQKQGGNGNNHPPKQGGPGGGAQQHRGGSNGHSGNPSRPLIEMPAMSIAMDEEGDDD